MVELFQVVILGIVEGLTEFLPISSTGHLIIAASLLQFAVQPDGTVNEVFRSTFEIFIQLGAVFAVIVYYRVDLLRQVRTVSTDRHVQRLWLNVVIAFIPAGAVGFLLRSWIKANLLDRPVIVAITLILGGIAFLVVERYFARTSSQPRAANLSDMRPMQALAVGIAQVTALIPGVSRSGASIVGGMLSGLNREVATQFSFYLAIPTLGIATLFDLVSSIKTLSRSDLLYLVVGMVVAAIVAWLAIGWLLRYVSRNNFIPFGYYRVALGIVVFVLVAIHVIT